MVKTDLELPSIGSFLTEKRPKNHEKSMKWTEIDQFSPDFTRFHGSIFVLGHLRHRRGHDLRRPGDAGGLQAGPYDASRRCGHQPKEIYTIVAT